MTSPSACSKVHLRRDMFHETPHLLIEHDGLRVEAHRFPSGVESVTIHTSRGEIVVLPYLGQMIWDVVFDGHSMTMKNMFSEPRLAKNIVGTYGCFAFHSGLLAAGCPGPEDDHPLHGEFAVSELQSAWLELGEQTVSVGGSFEWVEGFGHHYRASPRVTCSATETSVVIEMAVTNLSHGMPMPLQYMCHLNHAYRPQSTFDGDLPQSAFKVRESVPTHVTPNPAWSSFIKGLASGDESLDTLNRPERYDPEIVFFADDVAAFGETITAECEAPGGVRFFTEFSSQQFPVATRWILHNDDQQVAAFCLPGTSRPEGRHAAETAGTLIYLEPGETRRFSVTTGIRS